MAKELLVVAEMMVEGALLDYRLFIEEALDKSVVLTFNSISFTLTFCNVSSSTSAEVDLYNGDINFDLILAKRELHLSDLVFKLCDESKRMVLRLGDLISSGFGELGCRDFGLDSRAAKGSTKRVLDVGTADYTFTRAASHHMRIAEAELASAPFYKLWHVLYLYFVKLLN